MMIKEKSFTQKATIFNEAKQEMEALLISLFGEGYEIIIRKKTEGKPLSHSMYQAFCEQFYIDGSRKKEVVQYKHALMYILTEKRKYGSSEVGRLMGVEHSTVIYGKQRIVNDLQLYQDDIMPCLDEVEEFLKHHNF